VAGVNLFGNNTEEEKREIVFVEGQSLIPTSKFWKETDTSNFTGFTADTLFSDGNDGAHDMCRRTKNKFLKSGHSKHQWKQLFINITTKTSGRNSKEEHALQLALRMARTNPRVLTGWSGGNLEDNEITSAWAGAYEVLGGAWTQVRFSDDTPLKSPPKVSSALKAPRYSKKLPPASPPAAPATVSPKPITNPYYVVKKAPEPPKTKHKKKIYMQTTYLKIRLSSYWNNQINSYPEALTAVLMEWGRVVDVLCSRDPKGTAVFPWSDRDASRSPLTKDLVKPLTKDIVAKVYTDDFFLSKRQGGMYLRFRLGHTRPIAFYLESDEVLKGLEEGCDLYIDKIQDSNVSIPGWGAGPVIGRGSLEDIEEMLKLHPLMVSNKITDLEIRIQQVRLKQGMWIKGEPRPR
jgi:hypothetical protein